MKSIEQAKEIYAFCIQAAQNNNMLTYRDVLNHLCYGSKVGGRAIRYGLELAWMACAINDLPSVTAIVVNKATKAPSKGYTVKDWQKEAKRVFEERNWLKPSEIDWDHIWNDREHLSEIYGTTGYWGARNKS